MKVPNLLRNRRRLTPAQRRAFALSLLAGLLISAIFLFALARIHEDIAHPRVAALDHRILEAIHRHDNPALTALAKTLSFIGSPITLVPGTVLAVIVLWLRRFRHDAILVALTLGGGAALDTIFKLHYRRIRPEVPWAFVHEGSFSFPSGHSVLAMVLYGAVAWLAIKNLRRWPRTIALAACAALIAGIGLSRVYLGVHYPSDVLAGYFVGATWLAAIIAADRTFKHHGPRTRRAIQRKRRDATLKPADEETSKLPPNSSVY